MSKKMSAEAKARLRSAKVWMRELQTLMEFNPSSTIEFAVQNESDFPEGYSRATLQMPHVDDVAYLPDGRLILRSELGLYDDDPQEEDVEWYSAIVVTIC